MDTAQRERAQFYAQLASIPDLGKLEAWQRLKLESDFQRLLLPLLFEPGEDLRSASYKMTHEIFMIEGQTTPKGASKWSVEKLQQWIASQCLPDVHKRTNDIALLLDGQELALVFPTEVVRWALKDRVLIEEQELELRRHKIHFDLFALIRKTPFPFRRCPVCQLIFVPVRRQIYCSPICTSKGVEGARKDIKRDYMRDYMAKRRKKAKARQGRKEK